MLFFIYFHVLPLHLDSINYMSKDSVVVTIWSFYFTCKDDGRHAACFLRTAGSTHVVKLSQDSSEYILRRVCSMMNERAQLFSSHLFQVRTQRHNKPPTHALRSHIPMTSVPDPSLSGSVGHESPLASPHQ
jgi:hypothetical protein